MFEPQKATKNTRMRGSINYLTMCKPIKVHLKNDKIFLFLASTAQAYILPFYPPNRNSQEEDHTT